MTEFNKYELEDLAYAAMNKQAVEFNQAFDSLMLDKITSLVNDKKTEIAQSMFNDKLTFEEDNTEE